VHGYQADIDAKDSLFGDLYEEGGRGVLAKAGERVEIGKDGNKIIVAKFAKSDEIAAAIRWSDWNNYRVIARGSRLIQEVNGVRMVDVIDKQKDKARRQGVLALQLHAGAPMFVQFRDIRLKRFQ
jgi:hypothetical protein